MPIDWFDGEVSLTFEVGLTAATSEYGVWEVSEWGTALWGPDVVWSDLSSRLRPDISTNRGFSFEASTWQPGTAQFTLSNDDGLISPDKLDGPYSTGGISQIRPGRPVKLSATHNGVVYPLYAGYDDDWQETWEDGADVANVTVPCLDEMEILATFDGLEQTPVGAGETFGRRIHRILDNAGYTGERRIEDGENTMQATTLSQNAVTELKLTADSEGGAFFIDADGAVAAEGRHGLLENPRSNTVQATFGDSSGGLDEIPCHRMRTAFNRKPVRNIVEFARAGGTTQTVSDATSKNVYRERRSTRTDLVCETDSQVLELAQWHLTRLKQPEHRFEYVTIKPRTDPARMWPVALGTKVRDLVRVIRHAPGGVTIDRHCFVAGIQHQISKDDWVTTFQLSSANVYVIFAGSVWDAGQWDTARWSF